MKEYYIAIETVYPHNDKILFGWSDNIMVMRHLQNNWYANNLIIEIFTADNIMEFSQYINTTYDCAVDALLKYHLSIHYSYDVKMWVIVKDTYKSIFEDSAVSTGCARNIIFNIMLRYSLFEKYVIAGDFALCDNMYTCLCANNSGYKLDPVYLLILLFTIEYSDYLLPFTNAPETDNIDALIVGTLGSIVFGRN